MIFLMKDRHFHVIDSEIDNDRKALKWFSKHKEKVGAVMIDCSSRLHSDCYTMVYGNKFKTYVPHTQIWYTIALQDYDTPADSNYFVSRYLDCKTVSQFYNITALLYQLKQSEISGDHVSLGTREITLVSLKIQQSPMNEPVEWEPGEKVTKFLERFDMVVDTDKILQVPQPVVRSRQAELEKGYYIQRPTKDGGSHISYQWHDEKYLLRMSDGYWHMDDGALYWDITQEEIVGYCINGTGLLYLGEARLVAAIMATDGCTLQICHTNPHETSMIVTDYEAYNTVDVFYMGLFLPQIWDMIYYFETSYPEAVNVTFLFERHYEVRDTIALPKKGQSESDGIEMDLFACFAAVINTVNPRDISFDE